VTERKAFVIDVSRCSGCYNCQFACKDEHVGNDWSPYSRPQPTNGQFWLKIKEYTRGTLPKVKLHYIPVLCAHCENAACMEVCDDGAIYRRDDGLVIIDPVKCTGCGKCVPACPYGAVYFNDELNITQKCTGCAHLLDNGRSEPRCTEICHSGALRFIDESELGDIPEKATDLNPCGAGPRVYYLNIPKNFIGGMVFDSDKYEIVEGAVCRLTDGEKMLETTTDGFGDFWFEGLDKALWTLTVKAGGYKKLTIERISTEEESVNLGDIALSPENS
jgi:Fe-S-cluster-containing dehydrogenase component